MNQRVPIHQITNQSILCCFSFDRINNSSNGIESDRIMASTMNELDEQFRDTSREYEAEQPSLCESIAMGVASSGLLTGSAPVNIPRTGLDRPCLTPSPPALNLLGGLRMSGHDQLSNSVGNSNSLFFSQVRRVVAGKADREASWALDVLILTSRAVFTVTFLSFVVVDRLEASAIQVYLSMTGEIIKLVLAILVEA